MKETRLTEQEIDKMVVTQIGENKAWEEWQEVNPVKSISVDLSEKAIEGLKTIARLRGEKGIKVLLKKWIDERLIYEQQIIGEAKKAAK